jgi:hypothetical protein
VREGGLEGEGLAGLRVIEKTRLLMVCGGSKRMAVAVFSSFSRKMNTFDVPKV